YRALRDRPHHRGEPASSLKAWRKCRRDPRQELQTDSARTIRPARRAGGGRRVPRGRRLELHHGHHALSGWRRVPGPFLGQRFVSGHRPGKAFTLGAFSQSARIGAKTSTTLAPAAPAFAECTTWLVIVYVPPTPSSRDSPAITIVIEPRNTKPTCSFSCRCSGTCTLGSRSTKPTVTRSPLTGRANTPSQMRAGGTSATAR